MNVLRSVRRSPLNRYNRAVYGTERREHPGPRIVDGIGGIIS